MIAAARKNRNKWVFARLMASQENLANAGELNDSPEELRERFFFFFFIKTNSSIIPPLGNFLGN